MESPGIFLSFMAGVFSIASPCILPIIPSFLGYITGVSTSELYSTFDKKKHHRAILLDTFLFGVGFSTVFLFFGAVIGFIGESLVFNRPIFEKIAGLMIIFFGLQLTGLIQLKSLMKERAFHLPIRFQKIHHLRSLLIGIFFSFSWAPCYGPIVGTIFTLAATKANFLEAISLFIFYSLGFMTPLLVIAAFISRTNLFLKKIKKFTKYSSLISGIFVIILGVLLLTNQLGSIVNWVNLMQESL